SPGPAPPPRPPPPGRPPRQRAAEASIDADPLVRQLREQFAAVVRDGTIEPLEAKA
ncbi:DNA polymerase III subunit gamma/tau, partial [Pseudomonas aeruginosa]|nr:DNA polymerase III subunit gamma/tau [Pseudomonas aeruginosa]